MFSARWEYLVALMDIDSGFVWTTEAWRTATPITHQNTKAGEWRPIDVYGIYGWELIAPFGPMRQYDETSGYRYITVIFKRKQRREWERWDAHTNQPRQPLAQMWHDLTSFYTFLKTR